MADIARMDDILSMCIRDYGFKMIYERLMELAVEFKGVYEKEVAFLNSLSIMAQEPPQAPTPPSTPLLVVEQPAVQPTQPEVKVIQISERAAGKAEEAMDAKEFLLEPSAASAAPTSEGTKRKMKRVIHKNGKVIPVKAEPVTTDLEDEVVVVTQAQAQAQAQAAATPTTQAQEQAPRKTPAEIKKWQRAEEAARRAYMKKNKISRSSLMTVENMRTWLGNGQTFAWIAREQLGCKEEDVSKFAKENGLQRKKN